MSSPFAFVVHRFIVIAAVSRVLCTVLMEHYYLILSPPLTVPYVVLQITLITIFFISPLFFSGSTDRCVGSALSSLI